MAFELVTLNNTFRVKKVKEPHEVKPTLRITKERMFLNSDARDVHAQGLKYATVYIDTDTSRVGLKFHKEKVANAFAINVATKSKVTSLVTNPVIRKTILAGAKAKKFELITDPETNLVVFRY